MEDTIAAISTAYGEGGIGIVRVSGSMSLPLLEKIFEGPGKEGFISRKMRYGHILDPESGRRVDECMAVFIKGPSSYTTEDMAEIYCHGSVVSLRNTLALALRNGARLAEAGEFTKRAFLNGRIDLAQAEAVIDMVKAKTDSGYDMAIAQLDGELSRRVSAIRKELLELLIEMVVNIDYPEEDIEEITLKETEKKLSSIGDSIAEILGTSSTGRMLREGIRVAIAGRPNVGKSSLMNRILRENRAIVTDIPGTTRDTIEEAASIGNIPVIITDTAGIHDTDDRVEVLGIERSRKAFEDADYIILVLDGSRPLSAEDEGLLSEMGETPYLVVINKSDLDQVISDEDVRALKPDCDIVHTSMTADRGSAAIENSGNARTADEGTADIEKKIEELVYGGKVFQKNSLVVGNVRHIDLLRRAGEDISRGKAMAARREPLDIIEVDARAAYDALGEIIGETVSDEVLDEVFARFCLGK